jgi:hypothetical protein
MNTFQLVVGIGLLAVLLAVAVGLLPRLAGRERERSRQALLALARLRGWQEVATGGESLLPWRKSSWTRHASARGNWQGLRAELVITRVHKNRDATMVVVDCGRGDPGRGQVMATDPAFEYAQGAAAGPEQPTELGRRFRLLGQPTDLRAIFSNWIERAILEFPGHIHAVGYDGRLASVTWFGYEKDPAVVDVALDLAVGLCRQSAGPTPGRT